MQKKRSPAFRLIAILVLAAFTFCSVAATRYFIFSHDMKSSFTIALYVVVASLTIGLIWALFDTIFRQKR